MIDGHIKWVSLPLYPTNRDRNLKPWELGTGNRELKQSIQVPNEELLCMYVWALRRFMARIVIGRNDFFINFILILEFRVSSFDIQFLSQYNPIQYNHILYCALKKYAFIIYYLIHALYRQTKSSKGLKRRKQIIPQLCFKILNFISFMYSLFFVPARFFPSPIQRIPIYPLRK